MRRTMLLAVALLAFAGFSSAAEPAFIGPDLEGWEGLKEFWSYRDGALIGHAARDPGFNTFLCSKKKYKDFEMSFKVKLVDARGNSGVQIRSEVVDPKKYVVKGPQADIGDGYWGSLYGERFGGMMKASPAEKVKSVVKQKDFNDYSIRCVGKKVTIKVNGETMVDDEFPKMPDEGIIAFQLHAGGPMEVIFKDIVFKEIKK